MQKCWHENPDERPGFTDLRAEFTGLLESASCNYGYVDWIPDPKSPGADTAFSGYEFAIGLETHPNPRPSRSMIFDWESGEAIII